MSLSKASDIFKKGLSINQEGSTYTSQDIATRFNNTLNSLNEILSVSNNKNGSPIYSVWIKFQLGEADPILFDSQSDVYERNLIANLSMTKGQNGYANTFTLDIYYDAFKNGQETNQSTAEVLDDWVATAMSYDYNSDTNDFLKGYIQYGYNQLDDTDKELYTPVYEFYLTDANSETNFNSGITHYIFQGTSIISSDINFVTNIEKQKGRPLSIVKRVLTKYYGKSGDTFEGVTPDEGALGYTIDITETLINEQQTDDVDPEIDATYANPLAYCKNILDKYPLNQAEIDSGDYTLEKMQSMKEGQKPQYTLYITESNGKYTIHVNHVSKANLSEILSIDYMFDWSNTNNNIVTSWKPQADLKLYLIQMGKIKRSERNLETYKEEVKEAIQTGGIVSGVVTAIKNTAKYLKDKSEINTAKDELIKEYYDATLECIGIPADAPIGGIVRIKPVLFQSVSRTAGIYFIKGAEDNISSNGTYKTTLTLFRIHDLEKWTEYTTKTEEVQEETVSDTNSNNDNDKLDDTELWDHYKFNGNNPWGR